MTIELKLNAAAVASLFPEGSEARLQLQQCVIAEVTKRLVDRNVDKLRSVINAHVNKIEAIARKQFTDELETKGIKHSYWVTNPALSTEAKAAIAASATLQFNASIQQAVQDAAQPAIQEIKARLEKELSSGLEARLNALAKEALKNALK